MAALVMTLTKKASASSRPETRMLYTINHLH